MKTSIRYGTKYLWDYDCNHSFLSNRKMNSNPNKRSRARTGWIELSVTELEFNLIFDVLTFGPVGRDSPAIPRQPRYHPTKAQCRPYCTFPRHVYYIEGFESPTDAQPRQPISVAERQTSADQTRRTKPTVGQRRRPKPNGSSLGNQAGERSPLIPELGPNPNISIDRV
jgi:hypothetical protein